MKKLIPLFCLMLLCGCSGYKEINNGYLVTGIAFDKTSDGVKITVNAVLPEGEENMILSGSGEGLKSALNDLKKAQVKTLYFEHCGTVVLNQNLKDNVYSILEFCKNQIKTPIAARVVLCNDAGSLFLADRTGYDVISLLKNNNFKTDNRLYKIEQGVGKTVLPLLSVKQNTISFEGEIK